MTPDVLLYALGFLEHNPRFPANVPYWKGEPMPGKTLLIDTNFMGYGDVIQSCRYVQAARAASNAEIVLEVEPGLTRLLARNLCVQAIARGDPLPHTDAYVSLFKYGGTGLANDWVASYVNGETPNPHPYLFPLTPVGTPTGGVGIRWAGDPRSLNDQNRSIAFEVIRPLIAATPHVHWVCLQVDGRADECDLPIERITPTDWADTAQLVANLDLVISVDSSVAHLAGAMGVPTWLLLPNNADLFWNGRGDSTPLYPSIRVYRQRSWMEWAPAIERVAHDLLHAHPLTREPAA